MSVAAVRVDGRLVHGQVVETWLPALEVTRVLVVDTEAARSTLSQAAMRMALPPTVELSIVTADAVDWPEATSGDARTLVLVRSVDAALAVDRAIDLATLEVPLNVGMVQHTAGRRPITGGIHLSGEEIDALTTLAERGVRVELRSLPTQPPLSADEARTRFSKAG